MKNILTLLFISGSLFSFSQKTDENYAPAQYKTTSCRSSFEKIKLEGGNNIASVAQFLKRTIANVKDARVDLKLNYVNESVGGFHYSFTQTFSGIEIYQSEIKVNIDRNNVVHSVFDNSENTSGWNLNTINATAHAVIALMNEAPVLCEKKIKNNSIEVLEAAGEIIFQRDLNSYFTHDSLVGGKIFNPDPLTTGGHYYDVNTIYKNNGDADAPWLDIEEQTVAFHVNFTGSQFTLESPYVRISDFSLPNIAPVTSTVPQFYFNRSQSGFEDVNAFYHISTIRNYVSLLGFGCADSFIDVDTHALSGADNSYFAPPGDFSRRLYFGTGGVQDAEDADVIVHEYSHALSYNASPGSNTGNQRESLDEGFGDYMAGAYSKRLNTFNDQWVYNWDGHNEFWHGRILNSTDQYPADITNSIYTNGQIWSAVLFSINGDIGREATDSLILQTHYAYAQNILMANAATLLMDADTILNNGKYGCVIYNRLFEHGLNPFNPFIQCTVGINEIGISSFQFFNHNTSFTLVNRDGTQMQLQILNMAGQIILSVNENQPVFNYENQNLPTGVYLVSVKCKDEVKTFKWSNL